MNKHGLDLQLDRILSDLREAAAVQVSPQTETRHIAALTEAARGLAAARSLDQTFVIKPREQENAFSRFRQRTMRRAASIGLVTAFATAGIAAAAVVSSGPLFPDLPDSAMADDLPELPDEATTGQEQAAANQAQATENAAAGQEQAAANQTQAAQNAAVGQANSETAQQMSENAAAFTTAVGEVLDVFKSDLEVWTDCVADNAMTQGESQRDEGTRTTGPFDPTEGCIPRPSLDLPPPADFGIGGDSLAPESTPATTIPVPPVTTGPPTGTPTGPPTG